MKAYLDANFLVRLYLEAHGGEEARQSLQSSEVRKAWPLPVSTLTRMEVANALQRTVFESRTGGKRSVTAEIATVAEADFSDDLKSAVFIHSAHLSLEDLESQFADLVARHTAKHGFRTYDILHVASALHLGCDTFWSFDAKALKLAHLEGLKTNR